ncbi:TPA: hypothetical protein SHY03_003015 [Escherichia coli]|nr:hypothetical protein [Escherichia coli]
MTNTTLHLMHSLGWQGGTVHQVASATGLKVETVLNLGDHKVEEIDHFDTFVNGYLWACSGGGESKIPPGARGDMYFWLGVLSWQENKK